MDPTRIDLLEVAPRDGLQNEPEVLATEDKLALIRGALDAGARRVEVTSFVNPRRMPQMADAEAVCAGLPADDRARYTGLVLNRRGAERAVATERLHEIGMVAVASDTFGQRNQGMTAAQSIEEAKDVFAIARGAGLRPQATIAVAFGCVFEGEVAAQRVVNIAQALADAGAEELALADTVGVGVPGQVLSLIPAVRVAVGADMPLRGHFHDTRNTGIANAFAALQAGVDVLDASVGGIGGCPFAPRATGNIATEDLLYMLGRMDIDAAVDLDAVLATSRWLSSLLGRELPSMLGRAGPFPAAARDVA